MTRQQQRHQPLFCSLFLLLLVVLLLPTRTSGGAIANIMSDKIGIICDTEEHPEWKCLAGGIYNAGNSMFSGTYMCRPRSGKFFGLGRDYNQTVCIPTITNAALAEDGDTCGCCGGECPAPCTCACSNQDEDHVLVYEKKGLGLRAPKTECISPGKASRWTAMFPEEYTCVPDSECPALAPTGSPSNV